MDRSKEIRPFICADEPEAVELDVEPQRPGESDAAYIARIRAAAEELVVGHRERKP